MDRYILPFVQKDLERKMVFIGGPRQTGKTTLAKSLLPENTKGVYFNWDFDEDRTAIKNLKWNKDSKLIVFDELHKYSKWKNWIKGIYDKTVFPTLGTQERLRQSYLVTGSARLDVYRRGGDSLLGRYHYWRLHPFTLSEYPSEISLNEAFKRLMTIGGFPEPFLEGTESYANRWRQERLNRVIKDDLRDLELVRDISKLQLFVQILRERVGSTVSLSNIAADLEIAPKTAKHWLELLERMYLVFVVRPYSGGFGKTLLKQPKIYFFDNGDVIGDQGAKFENLVATSLLKELHFREDREGVNYELRYLRDRDKREVDFVIIKNRQLVSLIEAKWSDTTISNSLKYFGERLKPPNQLQVVGELEYPYEKDSIQVRSALDALTKFDFL